MRAEKEPEPLPARQWDRDRTRGGNALVRHRRHPPPARPATGRGAWRWRRATGWSGRPVHRPGSVDTGPKRRWCPGRVGAGRRWRRAAARRRRGRRHVQDSPIRVAVVGLDRAHAGVVPDAADHTGSQPVVPVRGQRHRRVRVGVGGQPRLARPRQFLDHLRVPQPARRHRPGRVGVAQVHPGQPPGQPGQHRLGLRLRRGAGQAGGVAGASGQVRSNVPRPPRHPRRTPAHRRHPPHHRLRPRPRPPHRPRNRPPRRHPLHRPPPPNPPGVHPVPISEYRGTGQTWRY